jgi:hypothetical protein
MGEQSENIRRVGMKIGHRIVSFWQGRLASGEPQFFMQDLVDYVQAGFAPASVAPDSTSRILRQLRLRGLIDYEVISRSNSHYRLLPLEYPEDRIYRDMEQLELDLED